MTVRDHPWTLVDAWTLSGTLSLTMAPCTCTPVPGAPGCVRCLCLVEIAAAGMAYAALGTLEDD